MRQLITAALHPHDYKWGLRPWTRHSLVVLVAGFVYVGVGATYSLSAAPESRQSSLAFALWFMPIQGWGVVWVAVGALAVVSSRWPPASETWGYQALSGLAALWSCIYLLGIISSGPQNLSGGLVWALVAFLWWAIAGLVSPAPAEPLAPPRREG